MFRIFRKTNDQQDKEYLANMLIETFKRLKGHNPRAKLRVPPHLKIWLLKRGFEPSDLVDHKQETILKPKPIDLDTYLLDDGQSN